MSQYFATGKVAEGEHFIGRGELSKSVYNMLFIDKKNVALVGLPRIGKTSLAARVMKYGEETNIINKEKIIIVSCNLASFESFEDLWKSIIIRLYTDCLEKNISHRVLEREYQNIIETTELDYTIIKTCVESFFMCLKKLEVRVILQVDEFDVAIGLFNDKRYYYEFFRDLGGSSNKFNVELLFISRQLIKKIETNAYGNSTLFGIFDEVAVRTFDDKDMDAYYQVLEKNGCVLTIEQKDDLIHYAGCSPYLLSIFGDRLLDDLSIGIMPNIKDIFSRERIHILNYFESLVKQMEHDGRLTNVLETVIGPIYKLTRSDVDLLESMGYLSNSLNSSDDHIPQWLVISEEFVAYLHSCKMDRPIWPTLTKTQKALQNLLKYKMPILLDVQSEDIDKALIEKGLITNLKLYESYIENNRITYQVNTSLIDVIPIWLLADIMRKYWNLTNGFRYTFRNQEYAFWNPIFEHLNKVRNPPAHGHLEYLTEEDIKVANKYCEDILIILSDFVDM